VIETGRLLPFAIAGLALLLLAINLQRFIDAEARPRLLEHLDFLPHPQVARALCLGHTNSVAKLRWIDSFAYFQYQLDAKDDQVASNNHDQRGGFARLYETFTALDPSFEPFYLHAATTISGLVEDHGSALGFLLLGVHRRPHSQALWINLTAHIAAYFDLERRQPEQMRDLLRSWAASTSDPYPAQSWLAAMQRRQHIRAPIVEYWLDRLRDSRPNSGQETLALQVLGRELRQWQLGLLQAMLVASEAGPRPLELEDLALDRIAAPTLRLPYSPIRLEAEGPRLLFAPDGSRWRLEGGQVGCGPADPGQAWRFR
jgi:hypothetical protein